LTEDVLTDIVSFLLTCCWYLVCDFTAISNARKLYSCTR